MSVTTDRKLASVISWVAGTIAAIVVILLPAGYFGLRHGVLSAAVQARAEINAEDVSRIISSNPELWMFQSSRLIEVITLHTAETSGESVQIFDARAGTVAQTNAVPAWPALTRSVTLFDAGTPVGRLQVSRPLRGVLAGTAVMAGLGLLLAAAVFAAFRNLPLRALHRAVDDLRESEERFRSLTVLSSDMYWEQDEQFRFTSMSGTGSRRLNVKTFPTIGKKRWEQNYLNMNADQWAEHIAVLEARKPFHDMELCRPDEAGKQIWISISGEPMFDRSGTFKGYRGVGKDITERKHDEERIQFLANHDALTSLPNRVMFGEVLNLAIQNARRYHRNFAVLFIDLDRFKIINDTLGHEAGDKLLQEMGTRLTQTVRSSDVVARLGGDEFVVLIQEASEPKQVAAVARKILSALVKPMSMQGQECRVTASIGICMYPAEAQDEQSLMKYADIAMYRAKEDGKNNYKFYSEEINIHSFERLALETSLRRGMERNEFFLHYQAKLDLHTGQITGVEALVRWQHPELGMVPPMQFIPLAEETGLIVPIGRWVLRTACAQNVAWQREGLPPLRMAVNLSARQFADENLLEDIAAALKDSEMKSELLELELTESMVMQNADRAGKVLAEIKKLGVRLAIDDFGVGYSSLTHLKRFPIDTLKVDRSFIRDLPQNAEDRAITEAIIAMGKSLKLTVVAEGVETLEQETFLRDHACDETQGFYFSKPIASDQFAELLRRRVESSK